ncbi:hypothetical protein M8C21_021135 [Ambrosia artemisiifolia]|uniref:RRM domain-containing protein n=1 Tax=Ambrosia artemisiifolia TaxID=4212 RepID=A0AAD5CJH6_AMBAR|nr:hypothetical protein M8C21_021135 [Ambrosia artemisiifolia]
MPLTNDDTFAEEEEEDDEDEDEDEDIFVPLSKMRQWSRNKPRGFGEGKVYDTSLEDNLLQQLDAAANPIPNSPKPKPKQGGEVVPNGVIVVRLFNLPKKKNIHRDLQAAFKGFPGIINILPAVSGNLKTRDPLCKGFAFLHFNSHNQANRFVDMVSTQPITFGKVQKQIRCEIIKQPSSVEIIETPLPVLNATTAPVTQTPLDPSVQDDDFAQLIEEKNEAHEVTSEKQKMVTLTEKGKKKTTRPSKKKVDNTPKLNIPPGSANRLG